MATTGVETNRFAELRRQIREAVKASENNRPALPPGAPPNIGLGWPHVGEELIASKASRNLSTPEKSQARLIARLKTFQYPYPEGNQRHKTFHRHVREEGLLDLLLHPPLLWDIRRAWFFHRYHAIGTRLHQERKSQHGHRLSFHREMMLEISAHLTRILRLARQGQVPRSWFAEYYGAVQKELLREASIVYPELLRWLKPATQIRPHSLEVDLQVDLFHAIEAAFRKRNVVNHKLAYQLAALICSPSNCIKTHRLDPSPETVRRNVRDRSEKLPTGYPPKN